MTWLVYAFIGPVLWATVNHIDKYLLSTHFRGSNVGALVLFSTLVSIFVLPLIAFFEPGVLDVTVQNAALLILVGVLSATAIWLYLEALDEDEASIVVPILQTIPMFGLLFSYLFLGEVLTAEQLIGCALIMLGSCIITLEIDLEQKLTLKRRVLLLMLGSSAALGLYETLFKFGALEERFWVATFWEHTGLLIVGLGVLTIPLYRRQFLNLLLRKGRTITTLNLGSEVLTIVGNITVNYALMLAPVAVVLTVMSTQPLWVFAIGALLTFFVPKYGRESMSTARVLQKLTAIVILFIGVVLTV